MQKTCFLLGFMGSGKSYWGPGLANLLGLPFVDLDVLIESAEGATVSDIFLRQGEVFFRHLEQRYLKETEIYAPCVLATGGGTVCFFDNLDWMQAHGITIYLKSPVPVLVSRLLGQQASRPLLQGIPDSEFENYIEKMLEVRTPFYEQAQIVADTSIASESFLDNLQAQIQSVSGK